MVNSKQFSERIQKIMDYYELSASAFADSIDIGRSSISHILSGRNKPSLDFVLKITEAYQEIDMYWLLNGKGTFPKTNTMAPPTSGLFQKKESTIVSSQKPVSEIPQDLFSKPNKEEKVTTSENIPEKNIHKDVNIEPLNTKEIDQIVIFYTDGTFEPYKKSNS